jgi:DNA-binding beta-propeller fold protein YncE
MVDRIPTGKGPVRVVITPDGKKLAIPLFHGAAVQFADTETLRVTHTIAVGPHPAGTCLSPDGRFVCISCEEENTVYVFDMKTLKVVQRIHTGDGADAMVCIYATEIDESLKYILR